MRYIYRMDMKQRLIRESDAYCQRAGITRARLATLVMNDNKFFARLEKGGSFTVATYERFMAFFVEHPPQSLDVKRGKAA